MSGVEDSRFDSWKEVATYLNRDLRTVRRWEKTRALPVHRVPGGGRAAIYAYRHEIDAWLSAERDKQQGNGGPSLAAGVPLSSDVISPHALKEALPSANLRSATHSTLPNKVAAILVLAVVGIAVALFIVFKTNSVNGAGIAAVDFSGSQILAQSNGKLAWSYDFGQPLRQLAPEDTGFKFQIQDWSGDGKKTIQIAVPLLMSERGDLSTDALYSFSLHGNLLWRHVFDDKIHFGSEDAGPRWEISRLMTTGEGVTKSLWFAICSFPTSVSVLMRSDASGRISRHFVNYGHLRTFNEIRTGSGTFLLVGGINNESDEGALAVLKETEVSGKSPQTGALALCDGCPSGQPYRYFLFPRSEVNRMVGPAYNNATNILVTGTRIQVMTSETSGPSSLADWALYDISAEDFLPRSVSFSDHYLLTHTRLSAEGKIGHTLARCPERLEPIIVREWSQEKGWTAISLPPVAAHAK